MPVDINLLGKDGKQLFREWKEKVRKHNSYLVKNKYHKERKMDSWNKELNEMNEHYRKALKNEEKKMKKVKHELDQMRKEEENLLMGQRKIHLHQLGIRGIIAMKIGNKN